MVEYAFTSTALQSHCYDLLTREEELWKITRKDPLNADFLFQYRQISLELYERQINFLQQKILEKHGKKVIIKSNVTFQRLNDIIGEYAKRILVQRDAHKQAVESGRPEEEIRTCESQLKFYHAELVKYLSEFRNVSKAARLELVETLSAHLASASLEPRMEASKRRFSVASLTLNTTKQEKLIRKQSIASLSKRVSTLFRLKKSDSEISLKPPVILPPGPESAEDYDPDLPTVLIQRNEYYALVQENERLKELVNSSRTNNSGLGINAFGDGDFEQFKGKRDDQEVWEKDSWRLEMLQKFMRDLEYTSKALKTSTEPTLISYHQLQHQKILIRIKILSQALPSTQIHTCIKQHTPISPDEIAISIGDLVTISMTFTDGLCHGTNLSTNVSGLFPKKVLDLNVVTDPATRAKELWNRLRVDFRVAIERELKDEYENWVRRRENNRFWSIILENYLI